jgi:hypothetical protein
MIVRPVLLGALLLTAPSLHAQGNDKPASILPSTEAVQLTLILKITDGGKLTTDQTYTLTASFPNFLTPSVRDGDRVPVATEIAGDKTAIQYIDTGTNIDVKELKSSGSTISMNIFLENSVAIADPTGKSDPIIRQARYSISPSVPLGKLVTIYSSSDEGKGHKVDIQLRVESVIPK